MVEMLSAGVYQQELPSGEVSLQGVSTSTYATIGWSQRGPVGRPTLVGSYAEWLRIFGRPWKHSDASFAMSGFFGEGGARAYFVRVVPTDATKAEGFLPGWSFLAASEGTWGNQLRATLRGNADSYDVETATFSLFDLIVDEETVDGAGDYANQESFLGLSLSDPDSADYILTRINNDRTGSAFLEAVSVTGGVPDEFTPTAVLGEASTPGAGGASQVFSGTLVEVPLAKMTLKVLVDGVLVAKDDGRGRIKAVEGSGYTSIVGTVNYVTGAYTITFQAGVPVSSEITLDYVKAGAQFLAAELSGAVDGTSVGRAELTAPELAEAKAGIYALDEIEELLNIGLADISESIQAKRDLASYCENRGDCFAILDIPKGFDAQDAVTYRNIDLGVLSSYAAIYYPNVRVADPLKNGLPKTVSPVGHIAGVYARTDNNRQVSKAPAGVIDGQLNTIDSVERVLTKTERDLVYPNQINPIASGPAFGRALYGSITLQKLGDYQQIGHRRGMNFIKKSFFVNSQDLVFEPLGEALFAIAKARFDGFLSGLAGNGFFSVTDPAGAFRVTIDGSNNTAQTSNQRVLVIDVLVSFANPAEKVLERFTRTLQPIA